MKKKIPKFFGSLWIFFCFPIHKKMNKSGSLDKNFLFLKKKIVSLKKNKICRIFKTNWEFFLPVHSPNLYGISIWKMHGRSHGNFFICFGDFQQQWICLGRNNKNKGSNSSVRYKLFSIITIKNRIVTSVDSFINR